MNRKVLLAALLAVVTVFGASAQKVVGDLSPLKGQTEINLVLDFEGTMVSKGSVGIGMGKPISETEEKFVADAIKGKSEKDKENWLKEWNVTLRNDSYSVLTRDMNNHLKKKFSVGDYPDAEYTIVVKVTLIETCFSPINKKASKVSADVSFVKTGETSPFATVTYSRLSNPASAYAGYFIKQIAMSFGMVGMNLGKAVAKVK